MPVLEREWGMLTCFFLSESIGVVEHPQLQPSVEGGPSGSLGGGRGAGKLEISVPHQDVEVPTKSYRKINNL